MPRYAQIVGWGKALPSRVMTKWRAESDRPPPPTSGFALAPAFAPGASPAPARRPHRWPSRAAQAAIETADIHPAHIDLVIVCTFSPEFGGMPSVASLVQDAIGAERAGAFDINAACAGFMYGLAVAQSMIVFRPMRYRAADRIGNAFLVPGLVGPHYLHPVR